MEYTRLKKADINISRISFGCQRFENSYDHDKHIQTIIYAFRKGINFFDTAGPYCDEQSEIILGKAINEFKKENRPFYISSKCIDGDAAAFRKKLERSLQRLNLDSIDFFTCFWGIKSSLDWQEAKRYGALDAMLRAKEEGLIRHICITTHMKSEDMIKVMNDHPFDLNIIGYNAINGAIRHDGLKASYESGAGNIAMNPLGTGIIVQYAEIFKAAVIRENQTLVQASYDYLLSNPYIHSVLGGFSNQTHVDDALHALENHSPYTKEETARVHQKLREKIDSLPLEYRHKVATDLCKKMYIFRDEIAGLMNVYPITFSAY
jgi:hypothetical protein